ncbi:MAG: oxidoreductase [Polyangiaceae bacterium]
MSARPFSAQDLPDLSGKVIVITGANSGIGFEAARALARASAHVVLACRNLTSAGESAERIRGEHPSAHVEISELDLASLASVRAFADRFTEGHERLDVLINNAGVMALPYKKTADGFEMQFGTNHLGHFALTGLLLPLLEKSAPARVVTVSSIAHQMGTIDFDDLQHEKSYQKWLAYGQSKLANLLFAYELDRRLRKRNVDVRSVACHPGYASTNLQYAAPKMSGSSFGLRMWQSFNGLIAQPAESGALPTLYSAVSDDAQGGDFIGPDGFMGMAGAPKKASSTAKSHDEALAARLWDVSEQLTGVSFG